RSSYARARRSGPARWTESTRWSQNHSSRYLLFLLICLFSVGAMGRTRIGEEQHLDRHGSARTRLRVADPLGKRLDQGFHLFVQRLQLVDGHVEQELAGAGRLLPLRRGVAPEREALLETVEIE